MARRRARLKPEDILWPVTERTVEAINHNFDILFRDLGLFDEVLPVRLGGTGTTEFATGDVVVALSTTMLGGVTAVAQYFALISQGVGVVPAWGKIGLTTHVSGILPIANGGTNASTKTAAFDNLSPLSAKGDLLTHDGTNNVRLPAPSEDNQMLISDSTTTEGVKWSPVLSSALLDLFLYGAADDVVATYRQALVDHSTGAQQDLDFAALASGDTLLEEWITDALGYDFIPDGITHLHIHAAKTAGTKTAQIYMEGYRRTPAGVETLHGTSSLSVPLTGVEDEIDIHFAASELDIDPEDYYVAKLYARVTSGGSAPTVRLSVEGDTFSRLEVPVPGNTGGGGAGLHDLLDATVHEDTETNAVVRGALVVGASLPFNGSFFWLDGAPLADLDSGTDVAAQQYWADGGVEGSIVFSDPTLLKWRRLMPSPGTLRYNGTDIVWSDDTVVQPKVKAFRSSLTLTIGTGAGALAFGGNTVELEDVVFDSHGFWDAGTNPERLTVPAGQGGIYLVVGQASWASSASGRKAAWIFVNGDRAAIAEVNGDDGGLGLSFSVSTFLQLSAGDYVELVVRQDSAGDLDLLGFTDASYTQLQMVRVAL